MFINFWAQCLLECCSVAVNWLFKILLHVPEILRESMLLDFRDPGGYGVDIYYKMLGGFCRDFKGCFVLDLL